MISDRDQIAFGEAAGYGGHNRVLYGLKFLKNWCLERLASSCPVPSWRTQLHRLRGVRLGKGVYVGYDVIFDRIHPDQITVGDYAEIGDRTIISAHSRGTLPLRDKYPRSVQPVRIGQGVWIAPHCTIIQGVEIGDRSVIGTGAVVTKSIPPGCLAVGVPARVVKKLE